MTEVGVLKRGICSCGWTGRWTDSDQSAADAAYLHAVIEECGGSWSVEREWPSLITDGRADADRIGV